MIRRLRTAPALRIQGLTAGWGRVDLLDGLDLCVQPGERTAVLGPNGAGKTTLFDAIAGRLRPRRGSIELGRHRVEQLRLHRRARLGLAYVPQEPSVFGDLTVRQNLLAAVRAPAARNAHPRDVDHALKQWSLEAVADRPAGVLSGGERRRVETARALLLQPSLLLLDEPFAGLDPSGRAALADGLSQLPPKVALLVTDHAADDVLALCDRVVLLLDGAVAYDGPVSGFSPELPAWRRYFA
ncbi:MAG: ATP-binding cassette domain-containing protein [Proteobacteria bacterium]|nr:ATP-binding cassette domain-containing protein [Pseudomonadota bacterium]